MKNNYQKGQIILDKIKRDGLRPSILLHACCGACSTYPIELLNDYFDITIYYNNDNIYPYEEYNKRLDALKKYIDIFNLNHNSNVKLIIKEYDNKSYMKLLSKRSNDLEKGPRCKLCFALRIKDTFIYASTHNFDYVGSVMSMSRQKDEQAINRIGTIFESIYHIKFLIHNFKKKGGQERRDELVNTYNIYDQKYCGCIYSLNQKNVAK